MVQSEQAERIHEQLRSHAIKTLEAWGYTCFSEAKIGKNRLDVLGVNDKPRPGFSKRIGIECQINCGDKVIAEKIGLYLPHVDQLIFSVPEQRKERVQRVIDDMGLDKGKKVVVWGTKMELPTTIPIDEKTRDRLKECGSKGDKYNDILNALIDAVGGPSHFKNLREAAEQK